MDVMERRRELLTMQNRPLLPIEYQQVEYIKTASLGERHNSYILTGIDNQTISKIICKYRIIVASSPNYSPMIVASYASGTVNADSPWATISGASQGYLSITPIYTPPWDDIFDTFIITYPVIESANSKYLRIGGWNDTAWTSEGAYYFVTVLNANDAEIAKFIPCYRKLDNKAGMYETINGVFYPSDGPKDFIAGPKI